jgi:hypothetical protein
MHGPPWFPRVALADHLISIPEGSRRQGGGLARELDLIEAVSDERRGDESAVLAQCLPMASMIVRFHHLQEPLQLLEGNQEPGVVSTNEYA